MARPITRSFSRQSMDTRSDITYVTDTISRRRAKKRNDCQNNDTQSLMDFQRPKRSHTISDHWAESSRIHDGDPSNQIFDTYDLPLPRVPFPSAKPSENARPELSSEEEDPPDEEVRDHLTAISATIRKMYKLGRYIINTHIFSNIITLIFLYSAVTYVNYSESKQHGNFDIESSASSRIRNNDDPNMSFLIFQQSRMEKEIQQLKLELDNYSIKSKETYSLEMKNCMRLVGDVRNEMASNVLSIEDKLRQTQSELTSYVGRLQHDVQELLDFKNDTAHSVKIRFDNWIKDEYRSDEFRIVIDEQLDKREKKASIFDTFGSFGSNRLQDVEALINSKLREYHEDKTGKVDFALKTNGAEVVTHRCTPSKVDHSRYMRVLGFSVMTFQNTPDRAIEEAVSPGSCWAFDGARGHLLVKLSKPILVTSITVEHIPKNLSPTGSISAPRAFTVSAMSNDNDLVGHELGTWEYNVSDHPIQTFMIHRKMHFSTRLIDFRFESNWGGSYTCIYRVRVHGEHFE